MNIVYKPTSAKHIFVSGDVTIRGKTLGFTAHYFLGSDGIFRLSEKDGSWLTQRHNIYFRGEKHFDSDTTEAFAKKAMELLDLAVAEWVKNNPDALIKAEDEHIEKEIAKRQADIQLHLQKIKTLQDEIVQLSETWLKPRP